MNILGATFRTGSLKALHGVYLINLALETDAAYDIQRDEGEKSVFELHVVD